LSVKAPPSTRSSRHPSKHGSRHTVWAIVGATTLPHNSQRCSVVSRLKWQEDLGGARIACCDPSAARAPSRTRRRRLQPCPKLIPDASCRPSPDRSHVICVAPRDQLRQAQARLPKLPSSIVYRATLPSYRIHGPTCAILRRRTRPGCRSVHAPSLRSTLRVGAPAHLRAHQGRTGSSEGARRQAGNPTNVCAAGAISLKDAFVADTWGLLPAFGLPASATFADSLQR
jgi:hypothetical protein